jgi:hypothetical protein
VNELNMPGFKESDFAIYNRYGQLRVQRSLAAVQDARRSAKTPLEMERVLRQAEAALNQNRAERTAAEASFAKTRSRAAHHLREAAAKFDRCTLWGTRRVEMQLKLEHALAQFGAKHFTEAQAEAEQLVSELIGANAVAAVVTAPKATQAAPSNTGSDSAELRRSA